MNNKGTKDNMDTTNDTNNSNNDVDEHQEGVGQAPRPEPSSRTSNNRGNQALYQLEQDISTKQQGRLTTSSSSSRKPGAHSVTSLEQDILSKQQGQAMTHTATGTLTQFEQDLEAKHRSTSGGATPGAFSSSQVPSGNADLAALESDVAAKSRARPPSSSTSGVPGAYSEHTTTGHSQLNTLESDLIAKNRARPQGVGAYTEHSTGNSQLNTLENDLIAKNRARPQVALTSSPPTTTTGVGQLSTLEADIASKNRAFSTTTMATPGAHPAVGGGNNRLTALEQDMLAKNRTPFSGRADLSSLEQDVAAKNNARLSRGNNNNNNNNNNGNLESEAVVAALHASRQDRDRPVPLTSASPGSALYHLEHSVTEKASFLRNNNDTAAQQHYEPREQSRLFTNAGYNNDDHYNNNNRDDRSLHEIARLDERIANKGGGGVVLQQQPMHTDSNGSNFLSETGGLDPGYQVRIRRGEGLVGLDDNHATKPGEKGDDDEFVGVEQARADKDYSENRGGTGDGGGERPPVGDMEYGDMQGELAVATAIEEEEDNSFIPAAVEFDPDAKPPLFKNRRVRLFGCLGLLFVVSAAVAAVVITQVAGKDNGPTGPTMAPTTQRDVLGLEEQLVEVFGSRYFEDPASMQSKALEWLINEDQFQVQPDAENLVQRYIMAYLYFETSQEGPWRTCNPPVGDQPDFCYFEYLTNANPTYNFLEMYWHRWLSKLHECEWAGVICHADKVTDISLDAHYLSGTFPPELLKLDYLRKISLTHNTLVGSLPAGLADMKHLTDIALQYNEFTGTIPQEWYGAKNLIHLNIGGNNLKGSIPSEFGRLTDLQRIFLQNNLLSGMLPMELFELTSLKWLFIGDNEFTGPLATEVGKLTNLEHLWLHGNRFTGTIPTEIGLMSALQEADLHDTQMNGTIPEELYTRLFSRLNALDLSRSQFSGSISTNLGLCDKLDWLILVDNSFTGTVPTEVGRLTQLKRLELSGNDIRGSIPSQVCTLTGETRLFSLTADCATLATTGETPVFCPAGCCSECCNQDTQICLPTVR